MKVFIPARREINGIITPVPEGVKFFFFLKKELIFVAIHSQVFASIAPQMRMQITDQPFAISFRDTCVVLCENCSNSKRTG